MQLQRRSIAVGFHQATEILRFLPRRKPQGQSFHNEKSVQESPNEGEGTPRWQKAEQLLTFHRLILDATRWSNHLYLASALKSTKLSFLGPEVDGHLVGVATPS